MYDNGGMSSAPRAAGRGDPAGSGRGAPHPEARRSSDHHGDGPLVTWVGRCWYVENDPNSPYVCMYVYAVCYIGM